MITKEQRREYNRRYRAKQREQLQAKQAKRDRYDYRTLDERRADSRRFNLQHLYGIDPERIAVALAVQNGQCAICERYFNATLPHHVDHDHSTGEFRALLCPGCNKGLGQFDESPERLQKAAKFLEKWAEKRNEKAV